MLASFSKARKTQNMEELYARSESGVNAGTIQNRNLLVIEDDE